MSEASAPEDAFVELFAQVFGLEKAQLLVHEYPFRDIYDNGRFILGPGVRTVRAARRKCF